MRLPEIFLLLLILVYCASLPSLAKRAGKSSPLAFIPILNFIPFLKIIGRPWWWFILLLLPGVNLLMMVIINVELGIAFGKRSSKEQWIFGVLPWYAIANLAFKEKEVAYVGPRDWTGKKKSLPREWGEAIIFAVVAASVIRTFLFEAFTIPTPSMERSMLVGDYLFVSKMSYGAKIPQTPVSIPFVHNAIPGTMTNSYVDWFSLPYYRLPAIGEVERFDPVVFNFPNGDSTLVHPYYAGHDYYGLLHGEAYYIFRNENQMKYMSDTTGEAMYNAFIAQKSIYYAKARANFNDKHICTSCRQNAGPGGATVNGVKYRPVDKKENYIKRCIGLPGDNLKIIEQQVYINDQPIENPEGLQYEFKVYVTSTYTQDQQYQAIRKIAEKFELNYTELGYIGGNGDLIMTMTRDIAKDVETLSYVDSVRLVMNDLMKNNMGDYFPNSNFEQYKHWSKDNYGPVHIPAKGEKLSLQKKTYHSINVPFLFMKRTI
ncbi:MAG: S26 family signal peptidase [Flavobacteriales bacterium]